MSLDFNNLRDHLIANAEDADRLTDWPDSSWEAINRAGALRWSIPSLYGGTELGPVDRLCGMEEISKGCLTTAFVLSQREAAVKQLLRAPNYLKDRFLPALANGSAFLTVGLSQLTTSRQHKGPSLLATELAPDRFQLDGEIPWVTGADQATVIVIGASLQNGCQMIVALPADRPGVHIESPLPLAALVGSRTSLIRCHRVIVESDDVLSGPTENVLGKIGGGGLDTSCLAIGLAGAAIEFIQQEAESRADLQSISEPFEASINGLRKKLHELSITEPDPERALALRVDSTKLALRATQASLMIAKGAGFIAPHPVQRWTRQALFFLVWSCPRPVATEVLADFAGI